MSELLKQVLVWGFVECGFDKIVVDDFFDLHSYILVKNMNYK